jgi:hypothetical protein
MWKLIDMFVNAQSALMGTADARVESFGLGRVDNQHFWRGGDRSTRATHRTIGAPTRRSNLRPGEGRHVATGWRGCV